MSLLEARGLKKHFSGVAAVDGVSFHLAAGEMLALIGPNGAGKSTCFNLLNGQIRPDTGQVVLDGLDITGRSPRGMFRLGVGRTFQVAATFGSMSVRENVQVALASHAGESFRLLGDAGRRHRAAADGLLADVGLGARADTPAAILAYGDLKRLEIAVALANAPRLLLMDEPTAGMMPADRRDLMALVRQLVRGRKLGVLFTEHDMDAVFGSADRILVMNHGKLIAEGAPAEIRANRLVQATYLGEEN